MNKLFFSLKVLSPTVFLSTLLFLNRKSLFCSPSVDFQKFDATELLLKYPNIALARSPAIELLVDTIRDKSISTQQYRHTANRLIRVLLEEVLALLATETIIKESCFGTYLTRQIPNGLSKVTAVSIMRSADSMVDKLIELQPNIKIAKVLVQRDEESVNKDAIFYYSKMPKDIKGDQVILLDPMVGTGGSAIKTIECLEKEGVKTENITFVCVLSCEEGLTNIMKRFPKVKILTAAIDPFLLPNKYLAPGLGDFGDRYYGTE